MYISEYIYVQQFTNFDQLFGRRFKNNYDYWLHSIKKNCSGYMYNYYNKRQFNWNLLKILSFDIKLLKH